MDLGERHGASRAVLLFCGAGHGETEIAPGGVIPVRVPKSDRKPLHSKVQ